MAIRTLTVIGTRPEAIKMAPVLLTLGQGSRFESALCVTAQHREMLDHALSLFGLVPDFDLDVMQAGQDRYDLTSRILLGMREVTERSEAVTPGTVELVGADSARIVQGVESVLCNSGRYQRMAQAVNPYGDGFAAGRTTNRMFEAMCR